MFSSAEIKEHLNINVRTEDGECTGRRGISALSCFLYFAKFEVCIFEAKIMDQMLYSYTHFTMTR